MKIGMCKHLCLWLLASALCIVTASSVLGWTSSWPILYELVHQKAITNVLGNRFSESELEILKSQQLEQDEEQNQTWDKSHLHSMTGVGPGKNCRGERPRFAEMTNDFISTNLTNAIQFKKNGKLTEAIKALGKAIHALQDATSPAHEGFQPWRFDEGLLSGYFHLYKEGTYPYEDDIYRKRLEGSVQWAYDIYIERKPIPDNFFNSKWLLQLPGTSHSINSENCN